MTISKLLIQILVLCSVSIAYAQSDLFVAYQKPKSFQTQRLKPAKQKTEDFKSVFFGHLLTPTTYLPKSDTVTVGSHVAGYSFNDNVLVGTASFLLLFYNSPNIYVKFGDKINKRQRWAVQANYLKSTDSYSLVEKEYIMDALMVWGIWSYQVTNFYTFHTSINYMNFFNEGNPHSLRREPFNGQPYQFSITTLHDVRVSKKFGLASEFGVLGVNYRIPNLHGAVSFRYMNKNLMLQFGISFDAHLPWSSFDAEEYAAINPTLGISNSKEFITHPEIALQYFF